MPDLDWLFLGTVISFTFGLTAGTVVWALGDFVWRCHRHTHTCPPAGTRKDHL